MDEKLPLLNVYETHEEGRHRFLVGFLDPVLAKSQGLKSHAMVGEFQPRQDGAFDPASFRLNPEFLAAFEGYMNLRSIKDEALIRDAREHPGEPMYVIDERFRGENPEGVPMTDVLGHFEVDLTGAIVKDSFQYNPKHLFFCPETGVSSVFYDRQFYAVLHPEYLGGAFSIFQGDSEAFGDD